MENTMEAENINTISKEHLDLIERFLAIFQRKSEKEIK
jgi:hypothetical protein